jgi:hypothetical protein
MGSDQKRVPQGAQASRLCVALASLRCYVSTQAGRLCPLTSFATQPQAVIIAPCRTPRDTCEPAPPIHSIVRLLSTRWFDPGSLLLSPEIMI